MTVKDVFRHLRPYGGIGGRQGEQHRHPVIVGDTIYAESLAYDLHTGAPKQGWNLKRNGCGTLSASASCLFYRSGNPIVARRCAE